MLMDDDVCPRSTRQLLESCSYVSLGIKTYLCGREAITPHVLCRDWSRHLAALERQQPGLTVVDARAAAIPTWADLDGQLAGLATELANAASRDDFQDVGRRAREVVIDCARLLADPALARDGPAPPKVVDAKAWAAGPSRDDRRLVRDAWDLAQKVTHGDLSRVDAFAPAQKAVL